MKTNVLLLLTCMVFSLGHSQEKSPVNPAKNWFYGFELGFSDGQPKNVVGGMFVEYYFAENWSISAAVKYYKTEVDFYKSGSDGFLFNTPSYHGNFKGTLLSFPVKVKWEFKVFKNLKGHLSLGPSYSHEIQTTYTGYSENIDPEEYVTRYLDPTGSSGLTYFFNKKTAVFIVHESFVGTQKGKTPSFLSNGVVLSGSGSTKIGVKFRF